MLHPLFFIYRHQYTYATTKLLVKQSRVMKYEVAPNNVITRQRKRSTLAHSELTVESPIGGVSRIYLFSDNRQ